MGQKCDICGKPYSFSESLRGALVCTECERQGKNKKADPVFAASTQQSTTVDAADRSVGVARQASARYADAYTVARAVNGIGVFIKVIGVILGVLTFVAGLIAGTQTEGSPKFVLGGLLVGVIVGVPIFVLGVLVSAQAQILKATLDTAVHSSPFLAKEDMERVMSL